MKKVPAVFIAASLLLTVACGRQVQDSEKLRSHLGASERSARTFEYREVSKDRAFTVAGQVEDDLRYRMTLSANGRALLEYIVSDDALAMRIVDPDVNEAITEPFGHPDVDQALREGRWVVDPSGAPSLARTEELAEPEAIGDPLVEALESLRFVRAATGEGRDVWEFRLEDLEYRPSQDPWVYPDDEVDETRFDVRPPDLPKSESQIMGGQGDIGPAYFRKLSAYVRDDRIWRLCEMVDIDSHEEAQRLRERGPESNPFLRDLLERAREGETTTPVRPRQILATFEYSNDVVVDFPAEAHIGRLQDAQEVLQTAFRTGLLEPSSPQRLADCLRPDDD